jgi:hypothetical protein
MSPMQLTPVGQETVSTTFQTPLSPDALVATTLREDDAVAGNPETLDEIIDDLKGRISHVKNRRQCSWTAYDYARHLSVLRFLEWSGKGLKTEKDVAREVAELLWEFKKSAKGDIKNSINHKANCIRVWAKEYRTTGKLSENAQGTHAKATSPLARQDITQAAQKGLSRLPNPSPKALQDLLLQTIFPNYGIEHPTISETTCRNYMEKWGWVPMKQGKWIRTGKGKLVEESVSDCRTPASSGTTVLDTRLAKSPETPRANLWHAPIPPPTPIPPVTPDVVTGVATLSSFTTRRTEYTVHSQPNPVEYPEPYQPYLNSMMVPSTNSDAIIWAQSQFPYTQDPTESFPNHDTSPFQSISPLSRVYSQQIPQSFAAYGLRDTAKPTDPLAMMGIPAPRFNAPPRTFVPDRAMHMSGHFRHDTTFLGGPRGNDGACGQQIPSQNYGSSNDSSSQQFMPNPNI